MKRLWLFFVALVWIYLVFGCNEQAYGSMEQIRTTFTGEEHFGLITCAQISTIFTISNSHDSKAWRATINLLSVVQFWPIEMLRRIPGPVFLIVYLILVGMCVGVGWLWIITDNTGSYPLPDLTRFDPFTIAALRGGRAAVIRTAVFSLWCRKLVGITIWKNFGIKKKVEIKSIREHNTLLNPIEQEVYNFLTAKRRPKDLFLEGPLKLRIEKHLKSVNAGLEELYLIPNKEQKKRRRRIAITMACVILVIGVLKFWLGFWNNKPIGFLSILLIVSPIAVYTILNWFETPTSLGRRYLKALKIQCEWLKEPVSLSRSPEGIDPAFSIAIFGPGVHKAFRKALPVITIGSLSGHSGIGGCGGGGGGCGGGCGGCGA